MDITEYNTVKNITAEEYFNNDKYSVDIFNVKYSNTKENGEKETPADVFWRICCSLSEDEILKNKWFSLMWDGWFRPGGSIISGIGSNKKASLANCTSLIIEDDTLEAIAKAEYELMKIAAYRQGVGFDASRLRPRGSKIGNAAEESTGVIPWIDKLTSISKYVGQKGRMPALLASLKVDHPDIEEFIGCKDDKTQINSANISVQISNSFMNAVLEDKDWELYFKVENGEEVKKTVRAKELFRKIAKHAHFSAEPGVQYIDLMREGSMVQCIADATGDKKYQIESTNACQPDFATILTPLGIRQLRDIKIGDTIWSGKKWTKVINKWGTGKKQVDKYNTTSGCFIGTSNHTIFSRGERIEAGQAKSIDSSEGEHCKVEKLDPYIVMDGLVIGDGSVHIASNYLVYLNIGEKDYDYFDSEIKHLILKDRRVAFKHGWEVETSISDTQLPKTYDRIIPNRYYLGDSKTVKSFLRGLFSANGTISGNRVCLKQSSFPLIRQVQEMLSSVGIRSYYTTNKKQTIKFSNGPYEVKESYDINITKDRKIFAEEIGFIQKYKMEKLNKIINIESNSSKKTFEIRSIENLGVFDVYEITVDDPDHTYWTGGCLVSNCSEKPLAPHSVCNLLSINQEKFSSESWEYLQEMAYVVPLAVRLSDAVIDYELNHNLSPLPQQKEMVKSLREIGMGITNIHGWLLRQDIPYDSDEAIEKVEEFTKYYAYFVFNSSVELGEELGNAPGWDLVNDKSAFLASTYFKNIVDEFYGGDYSKITHMRNMAHMSIAPTGSLSSTFAQPCISSGIEPAIGFYYWRKTRAVEKGNYTYYFIIPNRLKEYALTLIPRGSEDWEILNCFQGSAKDEDGKIGKSLINIINKYVSPSFFKPAHLIDPLQKIKMMGRVYKWVDAAISCTYNLPEKAIVEDVEEIYLTAWQEGVRAVSVYVEGSREGILIFEDPITNRTKNKQRNELCAERPLDINYVCAPKRPKSLPCAIHHCSIKGSPWIVIVGLMNDKPYEVFAGEGDDLYVPKNCKEGKLIKHGKGIYSLEVLIRNSEVVYKDVAKILMDDEQRALTRMLSLSLRHGAPLEFIQDQLKKADGEIGDFSAVVARVIGSYIKQSMVISKVNICPICKEPTLIKESSCTKCINENCGFSRCE